MKRLKQSLGRLTDELPSGFLHNLRWQYFATIGTGLLGGLYVVLLGRVLGVSEYGLYALCLSLATLVFNFFDLRLQEVTIRYLSHPESTTGGVTNAHALLRGLFLLDLAVRTLAIGAIFIFAYMFGMEFARNPHAFTYIMISAAVLFFSKVGNTTALGTLRVADRFEWTAWLTLVDWTLRLLVTVIVSMTIGLSIVRVLAITFVVGGAVNLLTIYFSIVAWRRKYKDRQPFGVKLGARGLWKFTASCYGISLCDNIVKEGDTALVGLFLDVNAVGIYRMAKNFVMIIYRVAEPIFLVIMPEFSRILHRQQRGELQRFLKRLVTILALFAGLIYIVTVAVMPFVVKFLLGPEFAPVAAIYPIMLSFILLGLPLVWTHALLAAAGRADLQFRASILGNISVVILLVGLTPLFGIYGASAGWSLGLAITFLLSYLFMRRAKIGIV